MDRTSLNAQELLGASRGPKRTPKRLGFAERLGQIYLTEYHPLNPRMPLFGPGAKMKGYVCAHGERLIEGTLEIEKKIAREELYLGRWAFPFFTSVISLALSEAHLLRYWS